MDQPKEKYSSRSAQVISLEKGKLPPQAVDLEEVVLGSMLIDAKGVDDVLSVTHNPAVFYKEAHQYIFEVIYNLWSQAKQVDLFTVAEGLKQKKLLDTVGGEYYLIQLTLKVSSSAHSEYHTRIILQKYIARLFIAMGNDFTEKGYDTTLDLFDLLEYGEKAFTEISEMISKGRTPLTWAQALLEVPKRVERLTNLEDGELIGVPTGLNKIDRFTGGWQKTDLIVIGARPGMGKTALIVRNMIEAAKQGYKVGFLSMEMSVIQLAIRGVSINSNYHMKQLNQTGFEHSKYFKVLNELVNEMQSLPIFIDDRPGLTIGEIKSRARTWKRKQGLDILFVDYIQLAGGTDDIRIRTGETSRGLKHIAKELDIPVIGLSQLSRGVESRGGSKRPMLHDLKEAGDIEQDADMVIFIYRPEYYGFNDYLDEGVLEDGENTELIVAKNRNGGLGTIGSWFDGNKTKFMDSRPLMYTQPEYEEDNGIDF